jgi:hypothetical protein
MDALSSLSKWSNLKWLYRLDSRPSPLETAVAVRVNAPSLVYKLSRVTRDSSIVKSVSFVFIMLVAQTPFTALVKDDVRYIHGEISSLDNISSPSE